MSSADPKCKKIIFLFVYLLLSRSSFNRNGKWIEYFHVIPFRKIYYDYAFFSFTLFLVLWQLKFNYSWTNGRYCSVNANEYHLCESVSAYFRETAKKKIEEEKKCKRNVNLLWMWHNPLPIKFIFFFVFGDRKQFVGENSWLVIRR